MDCFTITRRLPRALCSAADGELMWWTEGYSSRANAGHAVEVLRANAANAGAR